MSKIKRRAFSSGSLGSDLAFNFGAGISAAVAPIWAEFSPRSMPIAFYLRLPHVRVNGGYTDAQYHSFDVGNNEILHPSTDMRVQNWRHHTATQSQ